MPKNCVGIIGPSGVGKSTLMKWLKEGYYDSDMYHTIGVDYY